MVTIFFMCGWCICQVVFDLHVSEYNFM
jgi:hypothetical protein